MTTNAGVALAYTVINGDSQTLYIQSPQAVADLATVGEEIDVFGLPLGLFAGAGAAYAGVNLLPASVNTAFPVDVSLNADGSFRAFWEQGTTTTPDPSSGNSREQI